jgi:transcriptional regulator with XRE-family HTH domain
MSQPNEIEDSPSEAFVAELKRWRDVRGFSQSALARAVDYGPSYVSKVESGQQRPSSTFAASADRVLRTGGSLARAQAALDRPHPRPSIRAPRTEPGQLPAGDLNTPNLVVEHDEAELRYDGQTYRPRQRRLIYNAGTDPITRYLIRISVDRYPGDPDRSNLLYREDPLTWEELALSATHDDKNPMRWSVRYDRDAFKELWLCFENEHDRFPLYPRERAWIEYSYTVSDKKWGSWFQRAVRLPTKHLTVRLVFPSELPGDGLGHRDHHDRRGLTLPDSLRAGPGRRRRRVHVVDRRPSAPRPLPAGMALPPTADQQRADDPQRDHEPPRHRPGRRPDPSGGRPTV